MKQAERLIDLNQQVWTNKFNRKREKRDMGDMGEPDRRLCVTIVVVLLTICIVIGTAIYYICRCMVLENENTKLKESKTTGYIVSQLANKNQQIIYEDKDIIIRLEHKDKTN